MPNSPGFGRDRFQFPYSGEPGYHPPMTETPLEFFLVTAPGLEAPLADEARAAGFTVTETIPGGVSLQGGWPEVWRANLVLRGATRVLVRLASFRAMHLAQLDKRARKLPWADWLRPDVPVRVEATCRKSRIYHHRAAAQRVEKALTETLGVAIAKDAPVALKIRIEDDLCTISVDASGESLHKRGLKQAVNKAPMRETMAALFLRQCGFDGTEPVYDPMCGSGTFLLEAADMASRQLPGRARGFTFEHLASYDAAACDALRAAPTPPSTLPGFFGSDRDAGAIKISKSNAERAGLADLISFETKPISDITPPDGPPGLIIVNPPYGGRVGNKKPLFGLYGAFGQIMHDRFRGWRIGLITSDKSLARATGLPFLPPGPPIDHGGIRVNLWQTKPL